MKIYCKNLYQRILFLLLNIPLFLLFIYLYSQYWHHGYAFLILLFSCWLLTDINEIKNIPIKQNILFYIILSFVLAYYVSGNIFVSYFDLKNNYSGSKDAVNFIKKYNLQNCKINGLGMKSVALQPYFAEKIYNNYVDTTHFSWKENFYKLYDIKRTVYMPVIVLADWDFIAANPYHESFLSTIKKSYKEYYFYGEMYGINYANGNHERNSYRIYVDKTLADEINIKEKTLQELLDDIIMRNNNVQ